MNQPPLIEVKDGVVQNWQEIDSWARVHSGHWYKCIELSGIQRLADNNLLKLLACTLLHEVEELRARLERVMNETGWQPK